MVPERPHAVMDGARASGTSQNLDDAATGLPGDAASHMLRVEEPGGPIGQAILQGTRLRMLAVLGSDLAHERGGFTLQDLGQLLDCSPQNAHHHLRILHNVGAVHVVRTESTQRVPRQFWLTDLQGIHIEAPASEHHVMVRFRDDDAAAEALAGVIAAQARRGGRPELVERLGASTVRKLAALSADDRRALAVALTSTQRENGESTA